MVRSFDGTIFLMDYLVYYIFITIIANSKNYLKIMNLLKEFEAETVTWKEMFTQTGYLGNLGKAIVSSIHN